VNFEIKKTTYGSGQKTDAENTANLLAGAVFFVKLQLVHLHSAVIY